MNNLQFKEEIKAAKSLLDIFSVVNKHYDTTQPLGFISKAAITANIDKLLTAANVKPKK